MNNQLIIKRQVAVTGLVQQNDLNQFGRFKLDYPYKSQTLIYNFFAE